jgi:D-glycero-D-manno-heptose 1,7-bisphosphate phosphatase
LTGGRSGSRVPQSHVVAERSEEAAIVWDVAAVLFDRDGTLIEDVPYNGDPRLVRPMPGAFDALRALRARGVRTGVVSNQSGVDRGLITVADVRAVNARLDALLGPFDMIRFCPHGNDDGCRCRKPAPGMILDVLAELNVPPSRAAMVGDIGSDVEAGIAAGVRSIMVPTRQTLVEEVVAAPECAPDLATAVANLLVTLTNGDRRQW